MNQLIVDAKRKQRRASAGSKHDRMGSKQGLIDRHTPVYSSRITRVYIEYLHTYYPEIDIEEVLRYAEMTRPELEDSAHWFSQHQVNRFHAIIAEKTTNKNIAREVGRYAVSSEAMGIFKNVALSLVNPAAAYMLLGKLYLLVSRAVIIETRRIGDTQVEIIISFKSGVQEKAFQCNNRLGTMEAIGKHFSNQFSKVDHSQCIHKGDSKCVYRVKWKKSRALTWLRLRNLMAGSSVLLSTILIFSIPVSQWLYISLLLGLATISIQAYAQRLTIRDLGETVKTQGEISEQHLKDLNFLFNSSLLIEEI